MYFYSLSLDETLIALANNHLPRKLLIDVANGNMPKLHEAIINIKSKCPETIVMAGNVSSVEAYMELASTGCDFIRVGIGGSNVCNTTTITGVGQKNLKKLVRKCRKMKYAHLTHYSFTTLEKAVSQHGYKKAQKIFNISKCKIVADGISSYMNKLIKNGECLDNGYSAIINLLYAGADYVMLGGLFAKCEESASVKMVDAKGNKYLMYSGMSTVKNQAKYKNGDYRHSEGCETKIPVSWSLSEYIVGNGTDEVQGFVNALKSAMSYVGARNMDEFKEF
jgi:IMP dehydrogenase/GMP reductase